MAKHRKGCISQGFLSVNFTATALTIYYLLQLDTTEQYHQRHDELCHTIIGIKRTQNNKR